MQPLVDPNRTWVFTDIEDLPYDTWRQQYEIVDGALVVSPAPDRSHEIIQSLVFEALISSGRPDFFAFGNIGIDLGRSYRIPDVSVVRADALDRTGDRLSPSEVALVVEVESLSSRTTDRISKAAQYAAAGIPSYWRIERDAGVRLIAYRLAPEAQVYVEVGTWGRGEVARLTHPFGVELPIDAITAP